MKKQNKTLLFLFFWFLFSTQTQHTFPVFAATSCKVLNTAINTEYSGGCVNGLAQGQGTAKGKETYTGSFFELDVVSPSGTIFSKGKETYTGSFFEGNMHGKGTYVWANGDRYDGDWVNGVRTGKGVLSWAHGSYYAGEFDHGKHNNFGKLVLVKSDSGISSYGNTGKWMGETYVVEGFWEKGNILFACSDENSCLAQKKANEEKTAEAKANNTYKEAYAQATRGQFEQAIAMMRQIDNKHPQYSMAQKKIAEWQRLLEQRRIAAANNTYKEAYAQATRGQFEQAVAMMRQIDNKHPQYRMAQKKIAEWQRLLEQRRIAAGKADLARLRSLRNLRVGDCVCSTGHTSGFLYVNHYVLWTGRITAISSQGTTRVRISQAMSSKYFEGYSYDFLQDEVNKIPCHIYNLSDAYDWVKKNYY